VHQSWLMFATNFIIWPGLFSLLYMIVVLRVTGRANVWLKGWVVRSEFIRLIHDETDLRKSRRYRVALFINTFSVMCMCILFIYFIFVSLI
jgi:hypothetical protein